MKKRFVLLSFFTVLLLLGLIGARFIKSPLVESSSVEKISKIKHVKYFEFAEPNKPSSAVLIFEDGAVLVFKGVIENIEIGRTYRITHHKQHQFIQRVEYPVGGYVLFGNWSGEYYIR